MSENNSNRISWPLVLVVIIIVMIMTVGTSFLMVFLFTNNSASETADVNKTEKKVETKLGPMYSLGEFTVNLIGGRLTEYVNTEVFLEVEDEGHLEELRQREIQLRDAVIGILRSKTSEDVKGDIEPIKEEIRNKLNSFLAKGKIKNVYVNAFLTQ